MFMLPTTDHVVLGSSFAGDGIQLMTIWCSVANDPFIITLPSSLYDVKMLKET